VVQMADDSSHIDRDKLQVAKPRKGVGTK
jgi:hypothetical protein